MIGLLRGLLASPLAWLAGTTGFLARGGLLVLAVPILAVPTPVGVSLLVPPLAVTTSGVSSVLIPEAITGGAVALFAVAVALFLSVLAETVLYEQVVGLLRVPPSAPELAPVAVPPAPARPPLVGVLARLAGVELVALVPAAIVSIIAVGQLVAVGEQEYLSPSSTSVPYVERVLRGAAAPLVGVGLCLLLADLLWALASRRVLRGAYGPEGAMFVASFAPRSPARLAHRLVEVAGTWVLGWLVTLVTLAPGLAAIGLVWPAARDDYTATMSSAPPPDFELLAATVVLVATWLAAALLAGLGSAARAALWTAHAERAPCARTRVGSAGPSATLGHLDGVPQEARAR